MITVPLEDFFNHLLTKTAKYQDQMQNNYHLTKDLIAALLDRE